MVSKGLGFFGWGGEGWGAWASAGRQATHTATAARHERLKNLM
jgi:hypothetical protein